MLPRPINITYIMTICSSVTQSRYATELSNKSRSNSFKDKVKTFLSACSRQKGGHKILKSKFLKFFRGTGLNLKSFDHSWRITWIMYWNNIFSLNAPINNWSHARKSQHKAKNLQMRLDNDLVLKNIFEKYSSVKRLKLSTLFEVSSETRFQRGYSTLDRTTPTKYPQIKKRSQTISKSSTSNCTFIKVFLLKIMIFN